MTVDFITGCTVDFDSGHLLISYQSPGPGGEVYSETVAVEPYAAKEFCKGDEDAIRPGCERLFDNWQSMWATMENGFRRALNTNDWTIVARPQSLHHPEFVEIPVAEFSLYRIVDWRLGIGETRLGDRIYAIHVVRTVPADLSDEDRAFIQDWNASRKAAAAATILYRFISGDAQHIQRPDRDTITRALNGQIDMDFRSVLTRLIQPVCQTSQLSYDTAAKSVRFAKTLHENPRRQILLDFLKM